MNKTKLKKILEVIRSLQTASADVPRRKLVNLAQKLGRRRDTKRGKEGIFVSEVLPERPFVRIPSHPTVKSGTASNILNDLETDVFYLMERLNQDEDKKVS